MENRVAGKLANSELIPKPSIFPKTVLTARALSWAKPPRVVLLKTFSVVRTGHS